MVSHTPPCRPNSLHPGRTGLQKAGRRVASSAGLETRPGRHIDRQAHRVEVLSPAGRKKKTPQTHLCSLLAVDPRLRKLRNPRASMSPSTTTHHQPARHVANLPSEMLSLSH